MKSLNQTKARMQQWTVFKILQSKRGIALIMATTSLVIMNYIAMEIMYESSVEYIINSQNLHRIKAYYAAKAGLDISLLRLKLYVKIAPTVKLGRPKCSNVRSNLAVSICMALENSCWGHCDHNG